MVEVVTFNANAPGSKVQAGAQGWLTHYVNENNDDGQDWAYTRESQLSELPLRVLMADLNRDGQPDQLKLIVDYVNSQNGCNPA